MQQAKTKPCRSRTTDFDEFRGRVDERDVRQALKKAASISGADVDEFFADLPPEWLITDDLKAAWRQLILDRAVYLSKAADRVCSLL